MEVTFLGKGTNSSRVDPQRQVQVTRQLTEPTDPFAIIRNRQEAKRPVFQKPIKGDFLRGLSSQMINTTIVALVTSSLSSAPFFTNPKLSVYHSYFSRHLNSVFFGSPTFSQLSFTHVRFDKVLQSAISISGDSHSNEVITSSVQITDTAGSVDFNSCLFTHCQSSANGGGIQLGRWTTSVSLTVSSTGFTNCDSTKQGGAIYAQCGKFKLVKSCIDSCSAQEYAAFYESSTVSCTVQDVYFANINEQFTGSVVSVDYQKPVIYSVNFTNIKFPGGRSVLFSAGESIDIEGVYFANCQINSVLYISDDADSLTLINFVQNTARDSLLHVTSFSTVLQSCAFVKDNSNIIINKYVILRDCVFSDEFDPSMFANDCFTSACAFGAGWKTKSFDIYPSDGCWVLASKTSPTSPPSAEVPTPTIAEAPPKKGTSAAVVVLVLAIVIGGICGGVFLGLKWWRKRDDGGALLRMYAQV
jgi:hypothetical protein